MNCFNGLSTINIELTSKCQKDCPMCGRRKMEREHPELCRWGNMSWDIVLKLADQIPEDVVLQFHNNGEPLIYPYLNHVLKKFPNNIKSFNTNGILLLDRSHEFVGLVDTVVVSVIEDDDEQYETVKKFIEVKGNEKPFMIYRLLGDEPSPAKWSALPGLVCKRILHSPDGSFGYERPVTVPEIGICLDLLHHLSIDRYGNVFPCVRFDPYQYNLLGNVNDESLIDIWNSVKRKSMISEHVKGNRACSELCRQCEFWGIPRGV